MSVKEIKSDPSDGKSPLISGEQSPRIFTIGETTYDIQFRDGRPVGGCGGGSAFNSAVSLGRCGLPVSLITTFAWDKIGNLSHEMLLQNQVDCSNIKRFHGRSRVALAFFDQNQIPEYSFYPASEEAIPDYPDPKERDIILLGSSFALRNKGRKELLEFLDLSRNKGCIIIYDPNARKHLSEDKGMLVKIRENISFATLVKGSDEDFNFIFKTKNGAQAYHLIQKEGAQFLFYTKGAGGAELYGPELRLETEAQQIKVISTIGAGDNFSAGVVFGIYQKLLSGILLKDYSPADWKYILNSGTYFAAEVCQSAENYLPLKSADQLLEKIKWK